MILTEFQRMFEQEVLPYIENAVLEDKYTEPLFYTLCQPSNKFRSATALLAATMCGGCFSEVLPIAAASEIIHNSIIIQDDIADEDIIRRGRKSAWRKYGICHALHSAMCAVPLCLNLLDGLESDQAEQIKVNFLESYQQVCRAQIGQALLRPSLDIPYRKFLEIHLGKTAIGRWAITSPPIFYGNKKAAEALVRFAEKLGDAGSLKNDLEDFLQNDNYEPFCSDIRRGNLTYPLYFYFSQCREREKEEFLEVFGGDKIINFDLIRQQILEKGTIEHCRERISALVKQAISFLEEFPSSMEKNLLIAWARNHII